MLDEGQVVVLLCLQTAVTIFVPQQVLDGGKPSRQLGTDPARQQAVRQTVLFVP